LGSRLEGCLIAFFNMTQPKSLLLVAVLIIVALGTGPAVVDASVPLPSSSQPIYASFAADTYAVVQSDGTMTFSSDDDTFSVVIPATLRGDAYHVYQAKTSGYDVAVTKGSQIYIIRCTKSSHSCSAINTPVSIPLSPLDPKVIAIRPLDNEDSSIVAIASSDTIITWNLSSNKKISNLTWAFENHYTLNHVSGLRVAGAGPYYLMVALANSAQPSQAGVIVKVKCDSNGHLTVNRPPGITYMTIAPMNFVVSESYEDVRYWSQTNGSAHKGYVNAYAGHPWPPASTTLSTGQIISPSFVGEYPMTQVGIMAVGNPSTLGYDLLCLHFGYGMSSGPEVWISQRKHASSTMGLPILGFQTGPLVAEVMAVSRTSSGWSIISVDFGSCPMGFKAKQSIDASQTQNEVKKNAETLPGSLTTHGYQSCHPSTCSIDTDGDCTPQHCWGDATTGGFLCCKYPPV
jgi:hypothetical protein